ncbi:trimeric intracellular cation channel family protein [Lachnospiraceae bacterium C1.1]|nr:TRIC cation channel family protein [Lachnospiraceae bacterium C1.1]
MTYTDMIINSIEMLGTVAFACSGAMLGIRRNMDLLGVVIMGVVTAVGGGVIRDLVLGITPPGMFVDPIYTLVAMCSSLIVFIIAYIRKKQLVRRGKFDIVYDRILVLTDTLGLGIFTVSGIQTAIDHGYKTLFLLTFVGTVTGTGGGVIRDILAQQKPYIFMKNDIYACASIAGALVCIFTWNPFGQINAMLAGMLTVVILRMAAIRFKLRLPQV